MHCRSGYPGESFNGYLIGILFFVVLLFIFLIVYCSFVYLQLPKGLSHSRSTANNHVVSWANAIARDITTKHTQSYNIEERERVQIDIMMRSNQLMMPTMDNVR